jgi:hypothetical protein
MIVLRYNTFSANTWFCFPDNLGVSKGTWDTGPWDTILLKEDGDKFVLELDPDDRPLLGYPFAGKKGKKGKATCFKKGAIVYLDSLSYEVVSE